MSKARPVLQWAPSEQKPGEEACWFTHQGKRHYIRRDPVTGRCTHLARSVQGRTGRFVEQVMPLDSDEARAVLKAVRMKARA